MNIFFYKNKVVIRNINDDFDLLHILIKQINMNYYYSNNGLNEGCKYKLYYGEYKYIKDFYNLMVSCCKIYKYNAYKKRLLIIGNIIYDTMYSFFIYNKYHKIDNIKKYEYMIQNISSRKRFNCRDFYKIYSFI